MSKTNFREISRPFSTLSNNYNKFRPAYPKELFLSIVSFWNTKSSFKEKPQVADIGCGTGISTRTFYDALDGHCHIVGIEPDKEMLKAAIASSPPQLSHIEGSAEQMPLSDASIDILSVGQAAQWFDRSLFYKEAKRVLRPNGVIAIYENNRDWQRSKFLENHELFLETYAVEQDKKYSRNYRNFPYVTELSEHFSAVQTKEFCWIREMTPQEFLLMAKTSTQVQKAIFNIGMFETDTAILKNAMKHANQRGQVEVLYNSLVYKGKLRR